MHSRSFRRFMGGFVVLLGLALLHFALSENVAEHKLTFAVGALFLVGGLYRVITGR